MMTNPADSEINILLPFVVLIFVAIPILVIGGLFWFLCREKTIEYTKTNHLLEILRGMILSFVGIFIFAVLVNFAFAIIKNIIAFL